MKSISRKEGMRHPKKSTARCSPSRTKPRSSTTKADRATAHQSHRKYRYVVKVVEEVESSTAIESDKKLPWCRLKAIAERRRVKGELSLCGVKDVDMFCDEAYVDGKKVDRV